MKIKKSQQFIPNIYQIKSWIEKVRFTTTSNEIQYNIQQYKLMLLLYTCFMMVLTIVLTQDSQPNLLVREILELEQLIDLQQQKLQKLKTLRDVLIAENKTIPEMDEIIGQVLSQTKSKPQRQVPKLNQIKDNYQERSFMNRLLKKFVVNIDDGIKHASIITTFQYRTSVDTSSSQMLVVVTESQTIQIYDLTGVQLTNQKTSQFFFTLQGQKNITFITTSNRADDPIIATFGDGFVDVYKLESKRVSQKNSTEADTAEIPQSKYSSRIKIDCEIEMRFALQEHLLQITDFQYITIKGIKYFIFSEAKGLLSIYHRNGTFHGNKIIVEDEVIQLHRSYPNLLYSTQTGIGYFNPTTLEIVQPFCEYIPYRVIDVSLDIQQNNIIYVLTENGDIYIYEIRQQDGSCKIRQKISTNIDQTISKETHQLVSLRYFLFVVDRQSKQSLVYNTSDIMQDNLGLIDEPLKINFIGTKDQTTTNVVPIKGLGSSHYILVNEKSHNQSQCELSYFEIIMPIKKDSDFLSNLRIPIIIVALVLAFGYQLWSKGKSKQKKGGSQMTDEREIEELLSRKQAPGTNQRRISQGMGTSSEQKKMDQLTEQFDMIDKKAKQLDDIVKQQKISNNDQIRPSGVRPSNLKKFN